MTRALVLSASVVLAVALSSCDDDPPDTAALGGGGGAGGAAGAGGTADFCQLGELGACGPGMKCSLVDPFSGETDCVFTGTADAWTQCQLDSDCKELLYCDGVTAVCKPICDSADDCPGAGRCVPALLKLGDPLPGLMICTADCHPLTGEPCSDLLGAVACVAHNPGDDMPALDCVASQGGPEDTPCTQQGANTSTTECAQGLHCAFDTGQGAAFCKRWCTPPGMQAQCDAGQTCADAMITHQGAAYGLCP